MDRKMIVIIVILTLLLTTVAIRADDNADTGDGDTSSALEGKGFYRSSEYMYKVSIYVGLSDTASENGSLSSNWKKIGTQPLYIKPSSFELPSNVLGSSGSKIDYLNGQSLSPVYLNNYITDNPPPIPITNGGNIESVKSYFGDTRTLIGLIDGFAAQLGTSREGLVSGLYFTIDREKNQYPYEKIMPIKIDGEYQNEVPWLVIYEPVIISYLKDRSTILAFTSTEYALAQKLGYFNFKNGSDGQVIGGMTHSDLPNSIFLEESWFGYPVTSALAEGIYWSEDRIISGGGWVMRMLRPNSLEVEENDTTYDYKYRVDTDVITSVRVFSNDDITPDNRHISDIAYNYPTDNKATVTMVANGYSKSTDIVIPKGGSELVWIKWHTPTIPSTVEIRVQITGNQAAKIDGTFRSAIITGNVVDLDLNLPPNPTADDRSDGFVLPSMSVKADKTIAEWGIYSSDWVSDWVWHPKWEWQSDWQVVGNNWEDLGNWVDKGEWKDEGEWVFDYTNYYVLLSANMILKPGENVPTAIGDTMKSGYGVNVDITSYMFSNAASSDITYVQNAITYFPEFEYETYWRLLDMTSYGNFEFEKNKYSTYNNRTHFTPIWFPNGAYQVYTEVIDMWTPDGMLRMNLSDNVNIEGSLYDDWHIGPKKN